MKGILLLILFTFVRIDITCQKSCPTVANMEIKEKDRKFIITYDITGSDENSSHRIEFYVIDNKGNIVFPDSLTGDIGNGITGGPDKRIVWDIFSEFDIVYGTFDPHIIINGHEGYNIKGGPSNMFFSVLIPGLGDYFVEEQKDILLKPYLRTVASLGFITLGIIAGEKRDFIPPVWIPEHEVIGYHLVNHSWAFGPYIEPGHWADRGHYEYWLFKGDKEVLVTAGAAIWLCDVIWVYLKGKKNKQLEKQLQHRYELSLQSYGIGFTYIYAF